MPGSLGRLACPLGTLLIPLIALVLLFVEPAASRGNDWAGSELSWCAVVAAVLLSADCGLHQLRLCLDPHRRQPALLQAAHTAGYLACLAVLLLPALAPHSGGAADAARGLVVLAAVATTAAGCGELYLSWAARSLEATYMGVAPAEPDECGAADLSLQSIPALEEPDEELLARRLERALSTSSVETVSEKSLDPTDDILFSVEEPAVQESPKAYRWFQPRVEQLFESCCRRWQAEVAGAEAQHEAGAEAQLEAEIVLSVIQNTFIEKKTLVGFWRGSEELYRPLKQQLGYERDQAFKIVRLEHWEQLMQSQLQQIGPRKFDKWLKRVEREFVASSRKPPAVSSQSTGAASLRMMPSDLI